MRHPARTIPVLVLSVLVSAWAAPLIRLAGAPPPALAAWRVAIATLLLAPVFLAGQGLREWLALPARQRLVSVVAGTALALHFGSWIASVRLTSVAASSVLVALSPVFAWGLSWRLLGERPTTRQGIGIVLAVAGASLIALGDASGAGATNALAGDALALAGAVFGAIYFVSGRHLRQRLGLVAYIAPVYGVAAGLLLTAAAVRGQAWGPFGPKDWAIFAALAVGPTLIGHSGLNFALRHLPAWGVGAAALGEPIGATLIAWLLPSIAEIPKLPALAGGACCLAGIVLALSGAPGGEDR